jgi:hypothetical protein
MQSKPRTQPQQQQQQYAKPHSQKNLHSFFSITHPTTVKHKKCFIYVPEMKSAWFDYTPMDTDIFITTKSSVQLYYRSPVSLSKDLDIQSHLLIPNQTLSVPLLKSNLQKAIRRGHNHIAIQSAIQLIHLDRTQFLRRLPIIYIEDVCLMDSFPIVIWLMMAEKHYVLTVCDIDILLHCVNSLCECKKIVSHIDVLPKTYSHEYLENMNIHTQLLCLYYRSQYGGMHGDMRMLENAIEYYIQNPDSIERTQYDCINYREILQMDIEILVQAIDFHCFPHMLSMLEKKTGLDKTVIKDAIWNAESGYNIRKPETVERSATYMMNATWRVIYLHLDTVRDLLFSP